MSDITVGDPGIRYVIAVAASSAVLTRRDGLADRLDRSLGAGTHCVVGLASGTRPPAAGDPRPSTGSRGEGDPMTTVSLLLLGLAPPLILLAVGAITATVRLGGPAVPRRRGGRAAATGRRGVWSALAGLAHRRARVG